MTFPRAIDGADLMNMSDAGAADSERERKSRTRQGPIEPNYSWLVTEATQVYQVDADECRYEPDGGLSFHRADKLMLVAFPAGSWLNVEVMSQMTGSPHGRSLVAKRTSKTSPWQSVRS